MLFVKLTERKPEAININSGNTIYRQYALFECPVCHKQFEYTLSKGKINKTCSKCKRITHGMSKTPLYYIWVAMKQRCNNPNNSKYHIYGAKGIKVCDKWQTFAGFLEDNKDKYKEGLTIDRIDNNGDYCPENVQWITLEENSSKTSKKIPVNQYTVTVNPDRAVTYTFVKTWPSAQSAGEHYKVTPNHITQCCKGKRYKRVAGFAWKYAE